VNPKKRRNYLGVRALLALGIVAIATAASAQTTAFVVRSEPGDPVGQGQTLTYTPSSWTFSVARNAANGISLQIARPPEPGFVFPPQWTLSFSGPGGAPLTVGDYPNARRYGFTGLVGLVVDQAFPLVCSAGVTGRFLVRDIAYAANGDVLRLAIDLEQHCADIAPALFAAIRYNSMVPSDIFPGSTIGYSLTVSTTAHGRVAGPGIACGSGQSICGLTLTSASILMLTATPEPGYMFSGWSGACSGGPTTRLHVNSVLQCRAAFAPKVPTTPRTLLTLNSPTGWTTPVGVTQQYIYTLDNSLWQITAFGNSGLSILIRGIGRDFGVDWTLEFRAPAGQKLQEGTYFSESPAPPNPTLPFTRTPPPSSEVYGDGARCIGLAARLDVHQIEFDSNTGAVSAFGAEFEQSCGKTFPISLTGKVSYRATFEITCTTPDPFTSLGGGVCFRTGWLPPGMNIPGEPISPPPPALPPVPGGCTSTDPFASLGGGTCANGGWIPPGMPVPGGGSNPPPPPPTGCTTPDPFVSLGGGTCRNGGWLPPGMQ
jgi:hypothetical protein